MRRQELREHIFRLLFRVDFVEKDDLLKQGEMYFETPKEDEDSLPYDITDGDGRYIREKFELILNRLDRLDSIIKEASKGWDIERLGKVELSVLRLAVFELLYDDDIPTGVAIDQAVEISKKYGQSESFSFVNGILANIARDKDNYRDDQTLT